MKKKTIKIDAGIERRMAIGSVVSTPFLQGLSEVWNDKLVEAKFVRLVINWSISYLEKYGKAPGEDITQLFESNSENMEEVDKDLVKEFLYSISEESSRSDKFNADYLLDESSKHLHRMSLRRLHSKIGNALVVGDVESADNALMKWTSTIVPVRTDCLPFTDADRIQSSFEVVDRQLMSFPGPLGKIANRLFVRGGFVTLLGPEKRGKTWWLIEMAFRAMQAKCNVAFFAAGDMSEAQMINRFHIYLAGRNQDPESCKNIAVPVLDCELWQVGKGCRAIKPEDKLIDRPTEGRIELKDLWSLYNDKVVWKPCPRCEGCKRRVGSIWWNERKDLDPLTWRQALKNGRRFMKAVGGERLRLSSHPTDSLTVEAIDSKIDYWERKDGWVPDVVIIDYADILSARSRTLEHRHQENEKWTSMRQLSLRRHCLVMTATQANASSYEAWSLRMKHYSNDKRKWAHVTGGLGLNQTDEEKELGVMRVNVILARGIEFLASREAHVLQCLSIGRPCLGSFF